MENQEKVAVHMSKTSNRVVKFVNLSEFTEEFQERYLSGGVTGVYYNTDGHNTATDDDIVADCVGETMTGILKGTVTYRIQDREAGNVIESGLTLEEAKKTLAKYEETDRKDGTYVEDFYEIKEDEE